jgi:two-component system sensor histidine kinase KdpD
VPGSRNEKRWQDVGEILDAGIDVISTVNIQHLESINDEVDVGLEEYHRRHGITAPRETRERIVIGIAGAPASEGPHPPRGPHRPAGPRRAARVHARAEEGLAGPPTDRLEQHRKLLEDVGGEFHEAAGTDAAGALVAFARAENAPSRSSASGRSCWEEVVHGSVINRAIRLSGAIDVHAISNEREGGAHPRDAGR